MSVLNQIGNTPVVQYGGEVPNRNRIWLKLECENPFGSHYDRVYLRLFKQLEAEGKLHPGMTVLETTSGSAGVSFAGIGRELGYRCLVAIPAGGEKAREDAIRAVGGELIFTDAERYISGFPRFVKRFLVEHKDIYFLNHSMGPRGTENKTALEALGDIATELEGVEKLQTRFGFLNCFIAAVGNGSSVLGPARRFEAVTRIVTFEPFQSAVGYELLNPGMYEDEYGIKPGSLPRHRLPGTSFQGIDFPHIRLAFKDEQLVDKAFLIGDSTVAAQYEALTGRHFKSDIPRWDVYGNDPFVAKYGRTTWAGLATALHLAEQSRDEDFVIIAYDKADRYDH